MSSNVTVMVQTISNRTKALVGVTLSDFLAMEITPQEAILEPWLNTKSLNMLHAKRGVGKTYVGLSIAYAVATGTNYLKWKAPKPRKVVYLDGEMSSYTLQSRLKAISAATCCEPHLRGNLSIFTPDLQDGPIPDFADPKWHDSVRDFIGDAELVIVDNLSCLVRSGGPENDADSWNVLADWALKLRRQGVSVLFMHHSGKSGQQRGTSRKEDILNVVINLKHPAEYSPEMGATFEVHFEKGRELFGEQTKAFVAKLFSDEDIHKWEITDIEESHYEQVVMKTNLGLSPGEIAAEIGLTKSTISRHQKRGREEGRIKKSE